MPTLVIENGTVVTGANSYVEIEDVTAYADTHDGGAVWAALDDNNKVRAIVYAYEYLRNESRYMYRGIRHSFAQTGSWPRDDATMYRGQEVPPNVVPQIMLDAQCDLALRCAAAIGEGQPGPTTLQPDLEHGGMIQSEKIGPITTTFFPGGPPDTVLQSIQGILSPLLVGVIDEINPLFFPQELTPPYLPREFDYGSARPGWERITDGTI